MIKILMLFNVKWFYNSYVEILVYDLFKMVLLIGMCKYFYINKSDVMK